MSDDRAFAALFLLIGLTGCSLAYLAWLGSQGRLRPNRWTGIRTPFTMASEENWYRTHRAAAPILMAAGVALVVGGFLLAGAAIAGRLPSSVAIGALLTLAAVALVGAIGGWLIGTRSAKSH